MILCGDVAQSALDKDSGLLILSNIIENKPRLKESIARVDFNSYEHIVRSKACKDIIIAFDKSGY